MAADPHPADSHTTGPGADPVDPAAPPVSTRPPGRRVGPFSGRQLLAVALVLAVAGVGLSIATTPVGTFTPTPSPFAGATPFIVGPATEGLRPGQAAPEFTVTRTDGTQVDLLDLDGRPVRLADLRGKLVWVNFWASWCPPCQAETPVLRELDEAYADAGLAIVGVAVQETTPDNVAAYADRYELRYTIAFDASADVFRLYQVYAIPTQFFIDPEGRVLEVLIRPLSMAEATERVEAWLPEAPG